MYALISPICKIAKFSVYITKFSHLKVILGAKYGTLVVLEILDRADEFQDTIMDIANDIEMTLDDVCSEICFVSLQWQP